ncbi:MAG: group II intron reverse transcriptase/maturase [Planctomycetes bacterium]|nr:group II intron reverse transcriptase/maturase [Planctomycetota bacterium]
MTETPNSINISTKLKRIAQLAREMPGVALNNLTHNIDLPWMREAWRRTRKDAAPGLDGTTAQEYARNLDTNLKDLLDRAKSLRYQAPPVRRVYIPKGDGKETRPIGIPTLEDRILQCAAAMVLEAVYEQDFMPCSYGFRPGRSAHQALEALRNGVMEMGGGWVIDVDIRRFFDTLDHDHLRTILSQRVRDGILLRWIGKWLHAGVMESGQLTFPDAGTPQGGVISPLLANVYLHEVLDTWVERMVKPVLRGKVFLIRYADDFVLVFSREDDARRVYETLPKRTTKYGLTIHPEKTRLLAFRRPPRNAERSDEGSFNFLGFTHYWARSRRGAWVVKWSTSKDRLTRSLKRIRQWCRAHRHDPIEKQHRQLSIKMRGHYNYFGVTHNLRRLDEFFVQVRRSWRFWLNRRSQNAKMTWERFAQLELRWPLPRGRIVHCYSRPAAT